MEINEKAPVVTRDEIVIHAPIGTIWDIQTDVERWPEWQPGVTDVRAPHPLAVGATFHWRTDGLEIASTVSELIAPHRVVWSGPANGIVAVHAWTLAKTSEGILVRTQESWEGPPIDAAVERMQAALDGSLRTWMENLKRRAEATAP